MRQPDNLIKLTPLLNKPCFTSKQARELGVPSSSLIYYVNNQCLKRIGRGVYQCVSYQNTKSFRWEDLLQSISSMNHGVVCLISALAIYDLTEEIPREHWIAIPHNTTSSVGGFVKIVRMRNINLGVTAIELDGVKIPIFDPERTIVDAFRLLSIEIAIKALKKGIVSGRKNKIDLKKIENYARILRVNITPYLLSITTE